MGFLPGAKMYYTFLVIRCTLPAGKSDISRRNRLPAAHTKLEELKTTVDGVRGYLELFREKF